MNTFWRALFADLKDCGRDASLFFVSLVVLFALGIVAVVIEQSRFREWLVTALPWAGGLAVLWCLLAIRRARARRRERLERAPLSADELLKARMKLRNSR